MKRELVAGKEWQAGRQAGAGIQAVTFAYLSVPLVII
jgi:hypothetical protein